MCQDINLAPKCGAYIESHISPRLEFSNNLAHTVNDTLSLNLGVSSKLGPSCSKLTMSLVNDSLKF